MDRAGAGSLESSPGTASTTTDSRQRRPSGAQYLHLSSGGWGGWGSLLHAGSSLHLLCGCDPQKLVGGPERLHDHAHVP